MSDNGADVNVLDRPNQTTNSHESWLRVPDEESLPEEVQAIFQKQRDRFARVHSSEQDARTTDLQKRDAPFNCGRLLETQR